MIKQNDLVCKLQAKSPGVKRSRPDSQEERVISTASNYEKVEYL